jgi:hypothetical protein
MQTTIDEQTIFNSQEYTDMKNKRSARDHYIQLGASDDILKLVTTNNKTFGTFGERLVRNFFDLGMPENSQHDAICIGRKIEVKSPRYGRDGTYFVEHLKKEHDFEFILINLLTENGFSTMIMSKRNALPYFRLQKGEGYILHQKDIEKLSTVIRSPIDVKNFIKKYRAKSWLLN